MQLLHPQDDFSDIELGILLTHEHVIFDDLDQFTSRKKINNHVKIMLILKRFVKITTEILWLEQR
jgi:hypothetical protein